MKWYENLLQHTDNFVSVVYDFFGCKIKMAIKLKWCNKLFLVQNKVFTTKFYITTHFHYQKHAW